MTPNLSNIILASSSKYRSMLLKRIIPDFQCISPNIDESAVINEPIESMVKRLAITKAEEIAKTNSDALIIGSDQSAMFESQLIGKPKNHNDAVKHLMSVSEKSITLHTGIALINSKTNKIQSTVVPSTVTFRKLNEGLIHNYLKADQPYDCAGSVKVESLGILLIEHIRSDDPNALIGLPLIQLITMLNNENYNFFVNTR